MQNNPMPEAAELEIPWGVAMRMFKLKILKALEKNHKLPPKEAKALWSDSLTKEDVRIRQILEDLTNADS